MKMRVYCQIFSISAFAKNTFQVAFQLQDMVSHFVTPAFIADAPPV
jgi:hypothetical protein